LIVVSGATGEDGGLSVGARTVVDEMAGVITVSETESLLTGGVPDATGVVAPGRPQPAVNKSTAIPVRQQVAVILAAGPKRSIVFPILVIAYLIGLPVLSRVFQQHLLYHDSC
jgi:hypothetical protein